MSRRKQRNALYTRALAVGLGISLVVHATVLALGRFVGAPDTPRALTAVSLTEPEPNPERPEVRESERSPEEATRSGDAALLAWRPAEIREPRPAAVPSSPDLSEATRVARASAARVIAPLVPRPRLVPAKTEQGLTPVRVAPPTWMLADGKAVSGRSVGGGGIRVSGGHGVCPPGALPNRSGVLRIVGRR